MKADQLNSRNPITLSRILGWPVRRIQHWAGVYQRGGFYGMARPRWWPRSRRWMLGPQCEHDGRQVTIFAAGQRYTFDPAQMGRYRGHRYEGMLRPDATQMADRLASLALPVSAARAFAAVSSFEGGFDSIQTYDRAKFSWGFIQFAAIGGLSLLLQNIQQRDPDLFHAYFGVNQIDVAQGQITVTRGGKTLRGMGALNELHDNPALWKAFLLASHDASIQNMQISTAYENYYARIQAQVVYLGAVPLPLGELLTDEYSRAALFDRAVHRGMVFTIKLFQRAVQQANAGSPADAAQVLAAARRLEPLHEGRWAALQALFER